MSYPASTPPPLPVAQLPATSGAMKWLLAIAAVLGALVLGLLSLLLMGLSTGPLGFAIGMLLAVLPVPIYMLLALWCDRIEKEPFWMLMAAFLWGATAAVFFAFLLNTGFEVLMTGSLGANAGIATALVSAPFVEELAKGCALFILFLWQRDEFDGVLDGIIYATMVGLGFAMMENILYYGNALAKGGWGGSIATFILRGVVSPFAHPLFTSMTGIGLGLARTALRGSLRKFFAPLLGLGLAMCVHFVWNLSASLGAFFFLAYVFVMVPAFAGLITVVAISLWRERQIVREQLIPELRNGMVPERELAGLGTITGRLGAATRALREGGVSRWRAQLRFHNAASELAFHRWRVTRGILPRHESAAAREGRYLAQLEALTLQLGMRAGVPPPLPLPTAPRSRGGLFIALGSLGCLGLIVLAVVALGVLLLAAGENPESTREDPTSGQTLKEGY